jgi:hypothetical protein
LPGQLQLIPMRLTDSAETCILAIVVPGGIMVIIAQADASVILRFLLFELIHKCFHEPAILYPR